MTFETRCKKGNLNLEDFSDIILDLVEYLKHDPSNTYTITCHVEALAARKSCSQGEMAKRLQNGLIAETLLNAA